METCKSEAYSLFFFNVSFIFFKDYFDADHFKSLNFIEFVTVLLLFNFCLFVCFGHKARGSLSSLTRDGTYTPCLGK